MKAKLTLAAYLPLVIVTEAAPGSVLSNILVPGKDLNLANFREQPIRLLHATLGLSTEVGELVSAFHKSKASKKASLDMENLFEELGDTFWYLGLFRNAYPSLFVEDSMSARLMGSSKTAKLGALLRRVTITSSDLLDITKKILFYDRQYTNDVLRDTFLAAEDAILNVCTLLGFDPDEIRAANIQKLSKRYGDKFSEVAANNRDIKAEMDALGFTKK